MKTFNDTYQMIYDDLPPQSVTKEESKSPIITEPRGFLSDYDLTMQIQVGCPGGCLFCYVKGSARVVPSTVRGPDGKTWGFIVKDKQNVVKQIQKYIYNGTLSDKVIYWSGITDPYAASPGITKEIWNVLAEAPQHLRPRRIVLQTRFRPDRDIREISKYFQDTITTDNGPAVVVSYSIGTDRNDLIRAWERATPYYEKRIKTVCNLRQENIYVVPTLSPFTYWNDLEGTLKLFMDLGISYVTILFFKCKTKFSNTPKLFIQYLNSHYPELLDPSWQKNQLSLIKEVIGESRVIEGREGFISLTKPHLFESSMKGRTR